MGVAQGVPEDIIIEDLRANFNGECSEVGMYLAMSRVAHREGYPEIGLLLGESSIQKAEHAAKFGRASWRGYLQTAQEKILKCV